MMTYSHTQCSRIGLLILRWFQILKNMTFTFFWKWCMKNSQAFTKVLFSCVVSRSCPNFWTRCSMLVTHRLLTFGNWVQLKAEWLSSLWNYRLTYAFQRFFLQNLKTWLFASFSCCNTRCIEHCTHTCARARAHAHFSWRNIRMHACTVVWLWGALKMEDRKKQDWILKDHFAGAMALSAVKLCSAM